MPKNDVMASGYAPSRALTPSLCGADETDNGDDEIQDGSDLRHDEGEASAIANT